MRRTSLALLMLAVAHGGPGWAQIPTAPVAGPGDPRIREFYYDRDAVVPIEGRLGYEMMIEFNPDERIENVSIGDALAWQVAPNRKATLLFLKPMAKNRATSMTVVTSDRVYSFLLSVSERDMKPADQMLRLRFLYLPPPPLPLPPPPPPPAPPPVLNHDYTSSGSSRFVPVSVFDDGTSTFFQFDPAKGVPAVFFMAPDGSEETANTRMSGPYTIVDLTAETFVIRYGKTKTELRNKAWSRRPLPRPAPYPSSKGE
jgi:type IV secretion system protein VirB9